MAFSCVKLFNDVPRFAFEKQFYIKYKQKKNNTYISAILKTYRE